MKILVTGSNGQVGWELSQLNSAEHAIIALTRATLDITQEKAIETALSQFNPDILINCAAYTAVDKAETDSANAFSINGDGPKKLAIACKTRDIPLVHLSTDYVFDGAAKHPYRETDATIPLNVYGKSKLAGELAVRETWEKHIILRLSGVFSSHGHNFVKTILRLAHEKESLRIVADQIICPTPADAIAKTILIMCEKSAHSWGTYHYCSAEITNWFEFANAVIENAEPNEQLTLKEILSITTAEYPTPAKRPAYSVLDCNKIQSTFGITPCSWRDGLKRISELKSIKT